MPRPADVPERKVTGLDTITTRTAGITLKRIPAGTFQMGSPDGTGDKEEHPQHEVRITRPFYLGVTEVTQAQYEAVMGNNPSHFSATGDGKDKVAGQSTGQHPVEYVSWLDAVKLCNKLSEMEGRMPFYEINGETVRVPDWKASGYRLPTEAEWEYACGGDPADLEEHAWFDANSGGLPTLWGRSFRTGSAFMTCSATSGSIAGTLTTRVTTRNRRATIRPGRTLPRPRTGRSGVGAGTASRASAGRRTAGTCPTCGTPTWGSVWP